MSCETVQAALDDGAVHDPSLRAHLAECAACAAHERFVRALGASFAALERTPELAPALLARTRTRAARALRAHAPVPARGLLRELAGVLVVLALGLPLVLAHAWLVAEGALVLLGGILPPLLLEGLGVVYFGSLALAVGTLYALLPLWVATVRRARTERVRLLEHGT
jgi:hypothetical protein